MKLVRIDDETHKKILKVQAEYLAKGERMSISKIIDMAVNTLCKQGMQNRGMDEGLMRRIFEEVLEKYKKEVKQNIQEIQQVEETKPKEETKKEEKKEIVPDDFEHYARELEKAEEKEMEEAAKREVEKEEKKEEKEKFDISSLPYKHQRFYRFVRDHDMCTEGLVHEQLGYSYEEISEILQDLFKKGLIQYYFRNGVRYLSTKKTYKEMEKAVKEAEGKKEEKEKMMKVRITRDIEEQIVGTDGKYYGPFRAGDVAELPEDNALLLIRKGWAESERVLEKEKKKMKRDVEGYIRNKAKKVLLQYVYYAPDKLFEDEMMTKYERTFIKNLRTQGFIDDSNEELARKIFREVLEKYKKEVGKVV
ncbi:MAG: DNA replication complex subunit Gins51 [Candidatus Asgardarchaeia archaeon]